MSFSRCNKPGPQIGDGYDLEIANVNRGFTTVRVYLVPIQVFDITTVTTISFRLGSGGAATCKVGIYSDKPSDGANLTKLVESADTAMPGAGIYDVAVTPTTLQAGSYYLAIIATAGAAGYYQFTGSNWTPYGCYQYNPGSYILPSTIPRSGLVPFVGNVGLNESCPALVYNRA